MSEISITEILSLICPFNIGEQLMSEGSNCPNNRYRLSDDNIDKVLNSINNPSGNWEDYNRIWKYHQALSRHTNDRTGLLCNDDLPSEPNVDDYPIGS